ncbi:membrane protein [Tamlana nanhaiensis]|uniref:Membrane protein n=2 Tax=Neotamlana nanhaiensis TaxID=1382798 RepID=A0A0D7VY36_9FLAO|nr:membrane protein [Tamlana nanhaiensis]
MKMTRKILITAALLGLISIILGAFGAHGLKKLISEEAVQTFETGVKYQMYHALFLLFIAQTNYLSDKMKRIIFYLVLVGVIFFSGSIYGLATNNLSGFNFKSIGFITPIGGLLLILAWVFLLVAILRNYQKNTI